MTSEGATTDRVALLLVSHGERRPDASNRTLLAHVEALRIRTHLHVSAAVLNGEPSLNKAMDLIARSGADRLIVYPFFMSDGYFVSTVLPARLAGYRFAGSLSIRPPLGLDPLFAPFVLEQSVRAAVDASLDPADSHLLLVAHGSRRSEASFNATRALAGTLTDRHAFASVSTAYIEQSPLVGQELAAQSRAVVVAGLFSGEGVHGWSDVPAAIEETGAHAVYTGPLGAHPGVTEIIARSVAEHGS